MLIKLSAIAAYKFPQLFDLNLSKELLIKEPMGCTVFIYKFYNLNFKNKKKRKEVSFTF